MAHWLPLCAMNKLPRVGGPRRLRHCVREYDTNVQRRSRPLFELLGKRPDKPRIQHIMCADRCEVRCAPTRHNHEPLA